MITSKISSMIAGMVLTVTGTSAVVSSNIGHYLTAIGMVIAGIIFVIGYVRKEASSHQKIQDGVAKLQSDLSELLTTCGLRGEKSQKLGERVSKIEGKLP